MLNNYKRLVSSKHKLRSIIQQVRNVSDLQEKLRRNEVAD